VVVPRLFSAFIYPPTKSPASSKYFIQPVSLGKVRGSVIQSSFTPHWFV
jgi:hypothetical protein